MNKKYHLGIALGLLLFLAGCAKQKPADTSDPVASMDWIEYALDQSDQAKSIPKLKEIYEHGEALLQAHPADPDVNGFMEKNSGRLKQAAQQICHLSIPAKDKESFLWAAERLETIDLSFDELIQIWKLGKSWRAVATEQDPTAVSVFISEAIDDRAVTYFDDHIGEFKATGYTLKHPLTKNEFLARYFYFIGMEGEKAIEAGNGERVKFLAEHLYSLSSLKNCPAPIRERIESLVDYILYDLKNEALATELLTQGFTLAKLDLERIDPNSPFVKKLLSDPQKTVRLLNLDQSGQPITVTEMRFLMQAPVKELTNLHDQHIDEAIKLCMKAGGTQEALQFIQLKNKKSPLQEEDYIKLMTWSLIYGDSKIHELAKKNAGSVNASQLDLVELAENQRVFERFASRSLKSIIPSMEIEQTEDSISFGKIYMILENENEKAGLYILRKHNIEEDWQAINERTLLMDVCRAGNLLCARYLIEERRADISATTRYSQSQTTLFGSARASEGRISAIFFAAQNGNAELIKYLKTKGANVNATSNFGATPLMFAAEEGHMKAVEMLVSLGANVNAKMNESNRSQISNYSKLSTAYNRAMAGGHNEVAAFLKEKGARP